MRRPEQRNLTYSVRQPRWSSVDHSSIDCLVVFDHLPGENPFTAASHDSEPHGREIFRRLVAGDFGEIAPFEAKPGDITAYQYAVAFANFASTPAGSELLAEVADHNEEIASRSSRGLATLAETHLTKRLVQLLQIAGTTDNKIKRMSFSAKIAEAENIGGISQKERAALDLIREIRNEVAHESGDFYTSKILGLTQELHSCLASDMTYKPVSSLADQWIDLIFLDAFGLINRSLKARINPNIQARIIT